MSLISQAASSPSKLDISHLSMEGGMKSSVEALSIKEQSSMAHCRVRSERMVGSGIEQQSWAANIQPLGDAKLFVGSQIDDDEELYVHAHQHDKVAFGWSRVNISINNMKLSSNRV
jgi:hypothetical protein